MKVKRTGKTGLPFARKSGRKWGQRSGQKQDCGSQGKRDGKPQDGPEQVSDTSSYVLFQKQVTLTAGGGDTVGTPCGNPREGRVGAGRGSTEQGGRRPVRSCQTFPDGVHVRSESQGLGATPRWETIY